MNHSRTWLILVLATILMAALASQANNLPSVRAATAATNYYCVVGSAQSSGIKVFAAPQSNLQCFVTEAAAEHAELPYYFCVTSGSDGWNMTAYLQPQPGQKCYLTVREAIDSLPSSVQSIGAANAQSCTVQSPADSPPGSTYFVRCTNGIVAVAITLPAGSKTLARKTLARIGPRLHIRLLTLHVCHPTTRHHKTSCAGIPTTRWLRSGSRRGTAASQLGLVTSFQG